MRAASGWACLQVGLAARRRTGRPACVRDLLMAASYQARGARPRHVNCCAWGPCRGVWLQFPDLGSTKEGEMALDSLHGLYVDELKDLYNAENQLLKALPRMAKAASNPDLKAAFMEHLEVTARPGRAAGADLQGAGRQPQGQAVPGDGGADRRGQGAAGGEGRTVRHGRGADLRRPEGRALRDRRLRLGADVRRPARLRGGRAAAAGDARRGKGDGQEADRAGGGDRQPGGRGGE